MTQIALVGCAHIHTPKFVAMLIDRDDVTVAAVWDHDVERARRTAKKLHAPSVRDVEAIWADDTIRAVAICSETNLHPGLVRAALNAGKHLFVEKPLAVEADEARTLCAAIERSGLLFSTGFFMRGNGSNRFLRNEIADGKFGRITRIDVSIAHAGALAGWFDSEWHWMADPTQSGYGGLGDLGIHGVDLILWFLGYQAMPQRVTAWIGSTSGRYGEIDEFGRGQMAFSDGTIASVWASWADLENPVQLAISGTEGHAAIIDGRLSYRRRVKGEGAEVTPIHVPPDLGHAFELFLDALGDETTRELARASEAAICTAIIEAFYRAARDDGWVAVTSA